MTERTLTQKIACCIIPFILNSRTSRTNLLGSKIIRRRRIRRTVVASGVRGKGKNMRNLSGMIMYYLMFCNGSMGYRH